MKRMGFVKWWASSTPKVSATDFEHRRLQFIFDVKALIMLEDIPSDLVINWDQAGIQYVPVSNWTMAMEGAKRIEIVVKDDKGQITADFSGSMSGDFLPPQLIYEGKTKNSLQLSFLQIGM